MSNNIENKYRVVVDSLSDKWHLVWPLLEKHREELTVNKARMVLGPDIEKYRQLEKEGYLLTLLVYYGGIIVGYSCGAIARNMHYPVIQYHNDVLFLDKDHRPTRAGIMLLDDTEKEAKNRGADFVIWHAKPNTPLSKLLTRRKYAVQDILYMKEL